jgi:hypothetical protein
MLDLQSNITVIAESRETEPVAERDSAASKQEPAVQ